MINKPIKITDELLKEHFPVPVRGKPRVELRELFKAVMDEIRQEVNRALGHQQFCEPVQAVRRLADRYLEVRQERDDAQVVVKYDLERIQELRQLIADLTDEDDCWFDHHGYCQAHGWMFVEPKCPHARAKEALE